VARSWNPHSPPAPVESFPPPRARTSLCARARDDPQGRPATRASATSAVGQIGQPFGRDTGLAAQNIREKVLDIVCEQLGTSRDKVTDQTSFVNDLGADSLDTVELVMEFEDEFDLNIPDEDAEKIQTVGDAIKYIEEHQSK
jgi:acyl carrier protein